MTHLAESGAIFHENDVVVRFLFTHSLNWLEVLGWMGTSLDAVNALESLFSGLTRVGLSFFLRASYLIYIHGPV